MREGPTAVDRGPDLAKACSCDKVLELKRPFPRLAGWLLLPALIIWITRQEKRILRDGRPLSPEERAAASEVGVQEPEKLRIAVVDRVPMPGPVWLQRIAARLGYPAQSAIGMCLNRGIFLDRKAGNTFSVIVHECVHAAQYERLGVRRFLATYIEQCLREGYADAPLEKEAVQLTERVCRRQAKNPCQAGVPEHH